MKFVTFNIELTIPLGFVSLDNIFELILSADYHHLAFILDVWEYIKLFLKKKKKNIP